MERRRVRQTVNNRLLEGSRSIISRMLSLELPLLPLPLQLQLQPQQRTKWKLSLKPQRQLLLPIHRLYQQVETILNPLLVIRPAPLRVWDRRWCWEWESVPWLASCSFSSRLIPYTSSSIVYHPRTVTLFSLIPTRNLSLSVPFLHLALTPLAFSPHRIGAFQSSCFSLFRRLSFQMDTERQGGPFAFTLSSSCRGRAKHPERDVQPCKIVY